MVMVGWALVDGAADACDDGAVRVLIPPGGLVTYPLLPVWLVVGSVLVARRRRASERQPALV